MKYREISADISAKRVGIAGAAQVRITKRDNFELWSQSVRTPDVLLFVDHKPNEFLNSKPVEESDRGQATQSALGILSYILKNSLDILSLAARVAIALSPLGACPRNST